MQQKKKNDNVGHETQNSNGVIEEIADHGNIDDAAL